SAKKWGSCTALAPDGWSMTGNENRVGIGIDLTSPDQEMIVSYGVVYLPVAVYGGQDVYGNATPERALATMTGQALGVRGISWEPAISVDGDVVRTWRGGLAGGQGVRGIVRYRTFDAGTGAGYILAYRAGLTRAEGFAARRDLIYDVAASVRCTKHLFP